MADVNVGTISDAVSVAENTSEEVFLVEEISVNSAASTAESVSGKRDNNPNVADVISLAEYTDLDVAGEAATEVDDALFTQEEISAVGLYSKAVVPKRVRGYSGYMNVSISGTFVGTVVLQRSFDKGVTWHTVSSYTSITETSLTDEEIGVRYRLGCAAAWTSGTAICRLGCGGHV